MARRLALVTGGSRGIGRAIALALGKNGCDVAVNYNASAGAAEALCGELSALGARASAFRADVSDRSQVEALFKAVEAGMGPVEILVNNAGITRDNLLMRMKPEEWDAVLAANLSSAFYCTQSAIRGMAKARWGRIVNIASVVGLVGNAGQANYSASKAGLIGFSKSVAREYAARGVTVHVVAPGISRPGWQPLCRRAEGAGQGGDPGADSPGTHGVARGRGAGCGLFCL